MLRNSSFTSPVSGVESSEYMYVMLSELSRSGVASGSDEVEDEALLAGSNSWQLYWPRTLRSSVVLLVLTLKNYLREILVVSLQMQM